MIAFLRAATLMAGTGVLVTAVHGARAARPDGAGGVIALGLLVTGAVGAVALATGVAFVGGRVTGGGGRVHPSLPALVALPLSIAAFIAASLHVDAIRVADAAPFVARCVLAVVAVATILVGASLCRLAVTFPRPVSAEALEHARGRWNAHAAAPLPRLASWLGLPWTAWRWAAVLSAAILLSTAPLLVALTLLLAALAFAVLGVHGILYFHAAFALLEPEEKRRVRWVAVALFVPCALPALSQGVYLALTGLAAGLGALGLPAATAALLAAAASATAAILLAAIPVVLVGGLAIAIFWDGALDPRLVVRKTALYGILSGSLVVLFAGLESLLSDLLAVRLHFPERSGGWVAGVIVALLIGPARSRLEQRLERTARGKASRIPVGPADA